MSDGGATGGSDRRPRPTLRRPVGADDEELAAALEAAGYAGEDYEKFVIKLIKVTLPLLAHLIADGRAFDKLRKAGRGKALTSWEKQQFQMDPQVAFELAADTQVKTLARFLRLAREGKGWGGWRSDGGASITTWFINSCILDLANVYELWRKGLPPFEKSFDGVEPFLSRKPQETIPSKALLGGLADQEIEILMLHLVDKWKHKEIAELEGISEAASQERVRRAKLKLRQRSVEGK